MSSEESSTETPVEAPASRGELVVDVLKATYIPLLFGIVCAIGLVALWFYGVPTRPLALITVLVCVVGPFIVCYTFLFNWVIASKGSIPVAIVDKNGKQFGLIYFKRSEFANCVVEGGKLGTRQTKAGTMYLAEEYRIEQRERVNPDDGETEHYPQPVLKAGWEGEVDPLEVVERWEAYSEQKKKLVPLAQESVNVRASSDSKLVENSVRYSHGVVLGAEKDTFFDDTADPLDWDLSVDKEDITTVTGVVDDDDEREEPGSVELQREAERDVEATGEVADD